MTGGDLQARGGGVRRSDHTLRVDWPACAAHGLCAEILPEVVSLDEWGYPIVQEPVTADLLAMARSAVKACPTLALRLTQSRPGP
jgi:ferredoxin